MLNRYPLWKYILLIAVICISLLYALPNIYGEDPAVQVSGSRDKSVTITTQQQVKQVLDSHQIPVKSILFENNSLLVRVTDSKEQLKVKELITSELGKNYVVALNLISAAPTWLQMIGAKPMKLGLDLRGGVRFLMEVDMTSVLERLKEQARQSIQADFKDNNIDYRSMTQNAQNQIVIQFDNHDDRNKAVVRIRSFADYDIVNQEDKQLILAVSDKKLQQVKSDAVQQNTTILRNRVNQLGVAEPVIQRQGSERIVVELPGIQDTALAKKILSATATLEFRQVNESKSYNVADILSGRTRLPYGSEIKYTQTGQPILLYKNIVLTGDHITYSTYQTSEYGQPEVTISLDNAGGKKMLTFTQKNRYKKMATLFVEYKDSGKRDENGKPILEKHEEIINVATIQGIFSDRFQVSGISSIDEAKQLSMLLRAGALTAPIQIVEERTIGPTMGAKNIEQGLQSCLWGLIITVLFMLGFYRVFGLFASLALISNLILIVGVMSLIPGATLSMPGIAGIVLTVGIAVDANVLINERIKEELRNGRSPLHAINEGYAGAWSSIFDANITTLMTAVILYAVGTGSIKGFAITLGIGIITSMFTSILGTRALANIVYNGRRVSKLSI